jgi:hypothetical protein
MPSMPYSLSPFGVLFQQGEKTVRETNSFNRVLKVSLGEMALGGLPRIADKTGH